MDLNTFMETLKSQFNIVKYLSEKQDSKVILLKHKTLDKKIILRIYNSKQEVYMFLKTVLFENLPEIYESKQLSDSFAVLEEYIDGINVAEVIESGLYSYRGAKKVIGDICDALSILHENGFVHRDIKPENIMISKDGKVKLIDFNVSRRFKTTVKNDTVALGTIGYASPEQIGISQTGPAADIYALGVLFNVMLTGKHPSDSLVKGKGRKIILKCTQISPEKRFENVNKLKSAL